MRFAVMESAKADRSIFIRLFSPATRVFEAAGAGACLITDYWEGIDEFLEPERGVLVVRSGEEVAELVRSLSAERARDIGAAALQRVLAQHTYAQRVAQLEEVLASTRATASTRGGAVGGRV